MMQEALPRALAEAHGHDCSHYAVRFSSAFRLAGFDEPLPAGEYRVDIDEEAIEGASWLGWRRIGSFIHLPAISVKSSTQQMVPINPADLDAALAKDYPQS